MLNSILSNINDDGDKNEKTKNLKTRVGMFKNVGGNIPGGNFPGVSLMGGNFPGGSFPDTRQKFIQNTSCSFTTYSLLKARML